MASRPAVGASKYQPIKIVVFGSGGVGKSSLTLRFVTDTFSPEYLPTIEDCYRKQCVVDTLPAYLDILDTAGQEEYSALRDQWVREGKAFLLVFSCTNRHSFDELAAFRERILMVTEDEYVPMILVANKIDLVHERVVSRADAQALAASFGGIPYVECSALKSEGCNDAFYAAVREMRKLESEEEKRFQKQQQSKKSGWKFCTLL